MHVDDEGRLHRFDFDSPDFDLALEQVEQKIKAGKAKFEKYLCERAGITEGQLRELFESHRNVDVEKVINEWGPAFESHLDQAVPDKPEDLRKFGWYVKWEGEKDGREEKREEEIRRR